MVDVFLKFNENEKVTLSYRTNFPPKKGEYIEIKNEGTDGLFEVKKVTHKLNSNAGFKLFLECYEIEIEEVKEKPTKKKNKKII